MGRKVERAKTRTLKGNQREGSRGFSFVELLFVLLLLGFMLLLTFPNFRDFIGPRDMKRAVLSFIGALRYAQSQAAITKQKHRVNIDLKENAFWISMEGEKGQTTFLPQGIVFLDVFHPEGGKVREGTAHVDFSPTGWAEECTIHLKRGEQEVFTIFIHPLGGKVEMIAGYLERVKG
jgi:Tfp pilus assembly protein FimT